MLTNVVAMASLQGKESESFASQARSGINVLAPLSLQQYIWQPPDAPCYKRSWNMQESPRRENCTMSTQAAEMSTGGGENGPEALLRQTRPTFPRVLIDPELTTKVQALSICCWRAACRVSSSKAVLGFQGAPRGQCPPSVWFWYICLSAYRQASPPVSCKSWLPAYAHEAPACTEAGLFPTLGLPSAEGFLHRRCKAYGAHASLVSETLRPWQSGIKLSEMRKVSTQTVRRIMPACLDALRHGVCSHRRPP